MTISTTGNQVSYTGDGVSTVFAFPYPFITTVDLKVFINQVAQPTGFSVAGISPLGGSGTFSSGNVTFGAAPAVGAAVLIYCDPDLLQSTSLPPNDPFPSKTVEKMVDKLTLLIQRIYSKIGNAITFPLGETTNGVLPAAAVRANSILSFDSSGNVSVVAPAAQSATALSIDLANSVLASKGPALVAYNPLLTYPTGTVGYKLLESVSVLDYIPVALHAAIKAYTSAVDVTQYFNAALAAARTVFVPAGGYFTRRPINMTTRRNGVGLYSGRHLIGEGSANTIINAYTGVYPIVDRTGASNCILRGIAFRSDNPSYTTGLVAADCASIGIMNRRGQVSALTQFCHYNFDDDVRVNLVSDMTRNAGTGTVGFINCGGEHLKSSHLQLYANLPYVAHNTLLFAVANSSDIATFGVDYEQPYAGAAISTTVVENASASFISYDSFRAIWLSQVALFDFPVLYTSTRKLAGTTPAYAESFCLTSCASIRIDCYQEVSGKFGATYRVDHSYWTIDGSNSNITMRVLRGALDVGFTLPGASSPSGRFLNGAYLGGFDINCGNLLGDYNASGDALGLTSEAIAVTGTPNAFRNGVFTLDSAVSRTGGGDVFGPIGAYCTNVNGINFLSGASYYGNASGTFTPVAIGDSVAGTGTYTTQIGRWFRTGRMLHLTIQLSWTAHTGTGFFRIGGFPLPSATGAVATGSVFYDALTAAAGKQLTVALPPGATSAYLYASDPAGGSAGSPIALDTAVVNLAMHISYPI